VVVGVTNPIKKNGVLESRPKGRATVLACGYLSVVCVVETWGCSSGAVSVWSSPGRHGSPCTLFL